MRRWIEVGLYVVLFLSFLSLPVVVASSELDSSWQQAMYAIHEHKLILGRDFLWTYGPLAYLGMTIWDPSVSLFLVAFRILCAAAILLEIYILLRATPRRTRCFGLAGAILALNSLVETYTYDMVFQVLCFTYLFLLVVNRQAINPAESPSDSRTCVWASRAFCCLSCPCGNCRLWRPWRWL